MSNLFPVLGEAPGHEFQTQQARPLPPNLQGGPLPELQSRRSTGIASIESQSLMNTLPEPWRSLIYASQRKGNFQSVVGTVGATAILARPAESRTYLIVQNTSAANILFVGVGYQPTNNGTTITGLILAANGGNFEPSVIPQEDIYLLGNAAGTSFVIYLAQG